MSVVSQGNADNDRALYEHAARMTETFLDWRHRVMVFTFTADSALVALAGWMYDHDLRRAIAGPLVLAALISVAALGFDQRNQQILDRCYRRGAQLARDLGSSDGGPFDWIPSTRRGNAKTARRWLSTYHGLLATIYALVTAVLLVVSAFVLLQPPRPPSSMPASQPSVRGAAGSRWIQPEGTAARVKAPKR